jgi:dTMP kinase
MRGRAAGFFLVVEGMEGAGKSTLVRGLARRFQAGGIDPLLVREPGGTPVAEQVRGILLDGSHPVAPIAELLLFLAARADLVAGLIRPALSEGRTVLADRFALSTEAYQGAGRGIDLHSVRLANRVAMGDTIPDLTLVLDVPVELGLARIQAAGLPLDRIEREDAAFHARVSACFAEASGPDILHLDGSATPEQVLQAAWKEVAARHPVARGINRH